MIPTSGAPPSKVQISQPLVIKEAGLITSAIRVAIRLLSDVSRNALDILHLAHSFFERTTAAKYSDLVKEVDFKYNRKAIDGGNGREISSGSSPLHQFYILDRMMKNIDITGQLEGVQDRLKNVRKCFERSSKFFDMDLHMIKQPIAAFARNAFASALKDECRILQDGESFIFPAGTSAHAVLYKVTRSGDGLTLQLYNTGDGATLEYDNTGSERVSMPVYNIDLDEDIHGVFATILSKVKAKGAENYNSDIGTILYNYNCRERTGEATVHNLQDRGNCTWKSLSTCFSDLVKDIEIIADEKALSKLPDNEIKGELQNKPIPYKRLVKIVDYELIRDKIKHVEYKAGFSTIATTPALDRFNKKQQVKIFNALSLIVNKQIKLNNSNEPVFEISSEISKTIKDMTSEQIKAFVDVHKGNTTQIELLYFIKYPIYCKVVQALLEHIKKPMNSSIDKTVVGFLKEAGRKEEVIKLINLLAIRDATKEQLVKLVV